MNAHVRYKVTGGQSCYPVTISQLFCFSCPWHSDWGWNP
jgi:hypothetical protein